MFVAVERRILHADLDSFYASVEQRDDPRLRGRPVVVGGGVVLAASYEAKAYGVRSAMGGRDARRLCPQLITVAPRFEAYVTASRAVFEVFEQTTPYVEGISIDEAFLDVTGLHRVSGGALEIATALRRAVREQVGLAITVGAAPTKFLAKVASAVAKPDGLLVVPPGGELAFLHPLPVERLWGVGRVTAAKLRERGILTVADVAALDEAALVALLGRASGRHVSALAHNRDPRPVQVARRRRSIGAQRALGVRRIELAEIEAALAGLVDRVCRRLRKAERLCRTVVLRLRFADLSRITRSRTLPAASDETSVVLAAARALLQLAAPLIYDSGCSLVGVSLTNLADAHDAVQPELPFGARPSRRVDRTVDDVLAKFGSSAITRGVLLGRGGGMTVPMLPD